MTVRRSNRVRAHACAAVLACELVLVSLTGTPLLAQTTSVWLDASGSHTRAPGSDAAASTYGLLGGRVRFDARGSSLELGAMAGRGADVAAGSWINARGAFDVSHALGFVDFGGRLEGSGLTYLTPVDIGGGNDYTQELVSVTAQPHLGISAFGFRAGLEATVTRGAWRTEVRSPVTGGGPFPPLPGASQPRSTTKADGAVHVTGGAVSLLRMSGPASITVRAARYDARNSVAAGRYQGVDGNLGFALGVADIAIGARRWVTPLHESETGGHVALGIPLGNRAYVQAAATRSVTDPLTGARGSTGFSAGISLRLGTRAGGAAPAAVAGASNGAGRLVTFSLKAAAASTVAVAGDFSGWEQRAMRRGSDDQWTFETTLPPGVYHYSFIINGATWTVPDNAAGIVDDGFGRKNATIVVTETDGQTK